MEEIYKTSDLYLTAFLKAKRWFFRVEKQGNRVEFLFITTDELRECIVDYYNNGEIGVTDFKNAVQDLKNLIHNI